MDYLYQQNLADLIKSEDINFIGSAVTPFHAHGIDCAIQYLQEQRIKINGLIGVKPAIIQSEINHIITEKNFINKNCKVYKYPAAFNTTFFYVLRSLVDLYRAPKCYNNQRKKEDNRVIYIVSPWHLDIALFISLYRTLGQAYTFKMILVEEGLSSYFPEIDTTKHIWSILSTRKKGFSRLKSFFIQAATRYLRKRFERTTSWINLNLLLGPPDRLSPNPVSLKYYRQILTEYARQTLNNLPPSLDLSDSVVICTMAYLHSEIQDETDIYTLKLVVDELKRRDIKVYLKPHPRDVDYKNRYRTLECEFIDYPCTVESFLVAYPKLRGIVSFSSTSLVTAKLLFEKDSISILNLVEKEKYGKYIREEMDSFSYCFANIVEMPNTIKELGDYFF